MTTAARIPGAGALLLAACALTLGACSERAAVNPNAPGSPGTGNPTEVVQPAAPDGPPGGPSGIAGSSAHSGASGADAPLGTTGAGTSSAGAPPPGQGLDGGLDAQKKAAAAGTAAMGSGGNAALEGSTNTTSGNAVGQR